MVKEGSNKQRSSTIPPKNTKKTTIHATNLGIFFCIAVTIGSNNQAINNPIKTGEITIKTVFKNSNTFHVFNK